MSEITAKRSDSIRKMFSDISSKYDRANNLLSLGIHHVWRKTLVRWSEVKRGGRVLDCATGTGDLAFEFEKAVGPAGRVVGSDFCEDMLVQARRKGGERRSQAHFDVADVLKLPYESDSFDVASISFGIRNTGDPLQTLKELGRVVQSGGRVMVLEFGQPKNRAMRSAFGFYSEKVLPKIGGWISGKKDAYEYLQKSSHAFPCREEFLKIAKDTGVFSRTEYRSLSGGIAYLYRLTKG